jgi:hypothetical protein
VTWVIPSAIRATIIMASAVDPASTDYSAMVFKL